MNLKIISCYLMMYVALIGCSSMKRSGAPAGEMSPAPSPSKPNSETPCLFTGPDGTVYLSWIQRSENKTSLNFASLRHGRWSKPKVIASGDSWFVNWADYPMIAANRKQLVAHFLDRNGDGRYAYDIKLTTSHDNGKTWRAPSVLHDDKKQAEHGFVTLLPYGNNFFATWLDGRNTLMENPAGSNLHEGHRGAMSLRAAVIDAQGNKLDEWELDKRTCDCCQTTAAITKRGPVVIYRDRSDTEVRDLSIVRLEGGRWTEPQCIHEDHWKIAGCPVNGPRVAVEGNTLAVAWFTGASGNSRVNVMFSADGGITFDQPIRVDEGNAVGRVDVELLDNRTAVVSWMESGLIKIAKVHADGAKEWALKIDSSSGSRSSGFPQMTKSGNSLILAWTDEDEKNIKVATVSLGQSSRAVTHR
jgi:hypothetical protein